MTKPKTQTTTPPAKLLGAQEVVSAIKARTGVTFTTKRIFNLSVAGQFPEPSVRINKKTVFWNANEVANWIDENFASVP